MLTLASPAFGYARGVYLRHTCDQMTRGKRNLTEIEKNPFYKEIYDTANSADRSLTCSNSIDRIDIGIADMAEGCRRPIEFTRAELHEFLKNEKHKDLLVVWFDKLLMLKETAAQAEDVSKIKDFVSDLGYKRVLILGIHVFAIPVLYDSCDDARILMCADKMVGKYITVHGKLDPSRLPEYRVLSDEIDEPVYLRELAKPPGATELISVSGILHYFAGKAPTDKADAIHGCYYFNCDSAVIRRQN